MTTPQHDPSDVDVVAEWREGASPDRLRQLSPIHHRDAARDGGGRDRRGGDRTGQLRARCRVRVGNPAIQMQEWARNRRARHRHGSIARVRGGGRGERPSRRATQCNNGRSRGGGLPFAGGSFDAATCHFAVMFFPDVGAGLRGSARPSVPGRRAGFVAWGPAAGNTMFGAFWARPARICRRTHRPIRPWRPKTSPSRCGSPRPAPLPGTRCRRVCGRPRRDAHGNARLARTGRDQPCLLAGAHGRRREDRYRTPAGVPDDVLASLRRSERDGALHFSAPVIASGRAHSRR